MNIPTLNSDGRVDRPPHLFAAAIETSLESRIADMDSNPSQHAILASGSELASEVFASGLDWGPMSLRYRGAAVEHGVPFDVVDRHLSLSWDLAAYRPSRWIEMTRDWLWLSEGGWYHVSTGHVTDNHDFNSVFEDLWPADRAIPFFWNHMVFIEDLASDPSLSRGFHTIGDELFFNAP